MCNVTSWADTEVLARLIVDDMAGLMAIEPCWSNDEIGYVEGEESVAIESARISLRQHKCLGNNAACVDMTEIGPCEQTVVATGT